MELISNALYDLRSNYGHLIMVCLGADEQKCQPLQLELSKAGYAYTFFPISQDTLSRRDYLSKITEALDSCSCLIPVITDGLFADESVIYRNIFWFVIGYIQAKGNGGIVPYLAEGDGMHLSVTPLKNANLATTGTEVVKTLEHKYSHRLMKSQYYDNYLLNYYASKRILYRRLTLKCKIYEDAFQHIRQAMEYEWGTAAETKLDRFLATNLMCAYKVLGFGTENALEPQLEPYREEMHPNENGFASSVICKSAYNVVDSAECELTGVHAELDIEVVVPVHKLFGVFFKCYLSIKQADYFWMLPVLFSQDIGKLQASLLPDDDEMEDPKYWSNVFPENVYANFRKGRLYFSLGLERHNTSKSITLTPEMGVGGTADYIFPQ